MGGLGPSFGILEHVGRQSGKQYRTPLTVFNTDEGVAIMLTYGPDRDWLKKPDRGHGSATMRRHGRTITVSEPRVVTLREQAAAHVIGAARTCVPATVLRERVCSAAATMPRTVPHPAN